jgi:ornithine lipid ester-linked acyl 2-hydroxylase
MVLFVDFERPCRRSMNWINWLVLALVPMTSEIRRPKTQHDMWEKGYYDKD